MNTNDDDANGGKNKNEEKRILPFLGVPALKSILLTTAKSTKISNFD